MPLPLPVTFYTEAAHSHCPLPSCFPLSGQPEATTLSSPWSFLQHKRLLWNSAKPRGWCGGLAGKGKLRSLAMLCTFCLSLAGPGGCMPAWPWVTASWLGGRSSVQRLQLQQVSPGAFPFSGPSLSTAPTFLPSVSSSPTLQSCCWCWMGTWGYIPGGLDDDDDQRNYSLKFPFWPKVFFISVQFFLKKICFWIKTWAGGWGLQKEKIRSVKYLEVGENAPLSFDTCSLQS